MALVDPLIRVQHMLERAREAVEMSRGRSRSDMDSDRMLNLALVRLMEVIGEAAGRVPEDFRSDNPHVPWRDITDLRNRLIHGYDAVDFDRLWTIIHDDLPDLIEQLELIVHDNG
ncbi:MAG: DUF86 domain-containing protein [Dehalococcoidia bacterium]|nr:DUF86 domain-containing protein [Dehalococcoidia bacterium]